jgi:mono/diheme cytochrome c family protein
MRTEWIAIIALVAACGGAQQRGEPSGPTVTPRTTAQARGEIVFARMCYKCHPGGEQGLGPSLNEKPLPEAFIRTQVRTGGGAMPRFSKNDLTENDLGAVVDYLVALRRAPPRYGE